MAIELLPQTAAFRPELSRGLYTSDFGCREWLARAGVRPGGRVGGGRVAGESGSNPVRRRCPWSSSCAVSVRQESARTGSMTEQLVSTASAAADAAIPVEVPLLKSIAQPSWQHMVAGVLSGLFSKSILQPLDLVKTRLQVQRAGAGANASRVQYTGFLSAFPTIVRTEGFTALYTGLTPNLAGSGIAWGAYFFFYNVLKKEWAAHREKCQQGPLSAVHHLSSAAIAGVATSFLTNPIWMIKTRMQLQFRVGDSSYQSQHYKGMTDAFSRIVREEGFFALYRGMGAALVLVSNGALQFMAYEELKSFTLKYLVNNHQEQELSSVHFFAMGALAKTFSSTTTYPLQVTKSRLYQRTLVDTSTPSSGKGQYLYASARDVWSHILIHDGWRGFYRGLAPQLLKTVPSSALTFLAYEEVLRAFTLFRN